MRSADVEILDCPRGVLRRRLRVVRKVVSMVGEVCVAPSLEPRLVDAEWRALDREEKRRGRVVIFGGVKVGDAIAGTIRGVR